MELAIRELKVSIKTIMVDGKKMTAAFFRQIPESRISESSEGLGKVIYSYDLGHNWVLFVDNGTIYKQRFSCYQDEGVKDLVGAAYRTLPQLYIAV